MKRISFILAALLATVISSLFVGCVKNEIELTVQPQQLVGKWQETSTQQYYRYRDDSTGVRWNEAEDITEEESNLVFRWSVSGARLRLVYTGAQGNQAVPKVYTIREMGSSTMRWEDDYGISTSFIKTE